MSNLLSVEKSEFEGKYCPTFLRLEGKPRENGFEIPVNRTRAVVARTDVENGYLQRADNTGRLLIDDRVTAKFTIRTHLHDGRLVLFFAPIKGAVEVGASFSLKIGMLDNSMAQPVWTEAFQVRIIDKEKPPVPDDREKRKKRSADEGETKGTGKSAPTLGLPPFKLLTKDGGKRGQHDTEEWPQGFTENDGGLVQDLGAEQGVIYKINYDNVYHLRYRLQQRGDVARDVVTEKYILGMRILMLGYEHARRAVEKAIGEERVAALREFDGEFRRTAARGAASTVLALAENLPRIVDKASVTAVQEVE